MFEFRSATQHPTETIDSYVCRLRSLAKHCKFTDLDRELHAQILQGGISDEVRKHSLRKPDLKLDDLMIYARSLETSKLHRLVKCQVALGVSLKTSQLRSIKFWHIKNVVLSRVVTVVVFNRIKTSVQLSMPPVIFVKSPVILSAFAQRRLKTKHNQTTQSAVQNHSESHISINLHSARFMLLMTHQTHMLLLNLTVMKI